jgi:hypothetical protein
MCLLDTRSLLHLRVLTSRWSAPYVSEKPRPAAPARRIGHKYLIDAIRGNLKPISAQSDQTVRSHLGGSKHYEVQAPRIDTKCELSRCVMVRLRHRMCSVVDIKRDL